MLCNSPFQKPKFNFAKPFYKHTNTSFQITIYEVSNMATTKRHRENRYKYETLQNIVKKWNKNILTFETEF